MPNIKYNKKQFLEIKNQYENLEDENDHSGAAVLLAEKFGSQIDLIVLKGIQEMHDKIGSMPIELSNVRYEYSNRLYQSFFNEKKFHKV